MSATANLPQITAEWMQIFQQQYTETYTCSVTFMKQLTVVAVSSLTYLKNIFPEDNYIVQSLGGIRLRVLKKDCSDELAHFLSNALIQAFDAFENKYLHKLALCLYSGACDAENLVEAHVFEYSYTEGGGMQLSSRTRSQQYRSKKFGFEEVTDCTVRLLRACFTVVGLSQDSVGTCRDISVRLYYNEDAPEGYQAPGYSADGEDHVATAERVLDAIAVGGLETAYHRLDVRAYTRGPDDYSHDANASDCTPMMTQDCLMSGEASAGMFRCPCNNSSGEPGDLLTCQYCGTRQHAACFGVWSAVAGREHCCELCADADPARRHTDLTLASCRHPEKQESLCIFRRALRWLGGAGARAVAPAQLLREFQLTTLANQKLLRALHSYDVLHAPDTDEENSVRKINEKQLNATLEKFFYSEESMVERLVAESASQAQQDPVGDVLTPPERAALASHAAPASLATRAAPAAQASLASNGARDTALHRYQAALAASPLDTDLPLSSGSTQQRVKRRINEPDNKSSGAKMRRRGETPK